MTVPPGCCATPSASGNPASTSSNSASIAARTSGSSTPCAALNTIVPDCPPVPSSGKCCSRTAKPAALPEPGTSELILKFDPSAAAAAKIVRSATSQMPTARPRWSKLQPATRPRTVDGRRGAPPVREVGVVVGLVDAVGAVGVGMDPSSRSGLRGTSAVRPFATLRRDGPDLVRWNGAGLVLSADPSAAGLPYSGVRAPRCGPFVVGRTPGT